MLDHRSAPTALLLLVSLAACGGSSSSPAAPATVQSQAPVQAAGEGHIYFPGVAYDDQPEALIGDHLTDPQYLAVLCFDISAISEMTSATLVFHRSSSVGDPWSLGPLVVDHFIGDGMLVQAQKGGDNLAEAFHEFNTDAPTYTVDVTQRIAADVLAGRSYASFRIRFDLISNTNGIADQLLIATSKHADPSLHPLLIITTPAP